MTRRLTLPYGYAVDFALRQFRRSDDYSPLEWIAFESERGRRLSEKLMQGLDLRRSDDRLILQRLLA